MVRHTRRVRFHGWSFWSSFWVIFPFWHHSPALRRLPWALRRPCSVWRKDFLAPLAYRIPSGDVVQSIYSLELVVRLWVRVWIIIADDSGTSPASGWIAKTLLSLISICSYLEAVHWPWFQIYPGYLVGGIPTPLKNMKVNWDDYFQYMEK